MIIRLTPWAYPVIFQWLRKNWIGYDHAIQAIWMAKFQDPTLYWIELKFDTENQEDEIQITFMEKDGEPEESVRLQVEGIIEKLNDLKNAEDFYDL